MKVLSVSVRNFGSYKHLDLDLSDLGLTLIHGATGSGKSTLQDIIPWILYGRTAKDGNVDEVRSWKAGDAPTFGYIRLELADSQLLDIIRTRGTTKDNDLYLEYPGLDKEHRGKDMADTQKILNLILGMDAEAYSTAACFNEFSEAGLFFLAKSKDKRLVFEKVANLAFPAKLAAKLAEARKTTKKLLDGAENTAARYSDRFEDLVESKTTTTQYATNWEKAKSEQLQRLETKRKGFEKEKSSHIEALETKSYRFEEDKANKVNDLVDKLDDLGQRFDASRTVKEERLRKAVAALPKHCDKCGRANNTSESIERLKADIEKSNLIDRQFSEYSIKLRDIQAAVNPYKDQIVEAKKDKNHYDELISAKSKEENPFKEQLDKIEAAFPKAEEALKSQFANCELLESKHRALDQLYDLSFELRGILLRNVVKVIQNNTNSYLEKYFESEFKVSFDLVDADSLEVEIQKNSYPCVFKQLSKGQRQILKLCFSVSIMLGAAKNLGVSLNTLSFDESMDGLDPELKMKAYGLFDSLAKDHASVLVIEHDKEFRELFQNRYKVSLIGDESELHHDQL